MHISVSEAARKLGVSASTLRYYEGAGLVPAIERRAGRRVYRPSDLAALRLVILARKTGMGIAQIRKLRGLLFADRARADQKLSEQISVIDQTMDALATQRALLSRLAACGCADPVLCEVAS